MVVNGNLQQKKIGKNESITMYGVYRTLKGSEGGNQWDWKYNRRNSTSRNKRNKIDFRKLQTLVEKYKRHLTFMLTE